MHQKPSTAARWLKPAALTIAIAFGLSAAPYAVTGSLSLDGATALAKSDKAKGKGSKKSKKSKGPKKSVSRGNSGNNRGGGSDSLSFDSDGTQFTSTGRGKPKKWTTPRGKGQATVALETEEYDENGEEELDGYSIMPAPVRSWTKYEGLDQGYVASTLKGDNSINGLKGNFYGKLERAELGLNPNAKWSKQLNYLRDNAYADEAFNAFTSLGGDPENPPTDEEYQAAQDYLAAQALLEDTEGLPAEEIATATEIVETYEGEDAEDVVAQYDAWGDYETAEETASSSFDEAFTSGERDMIDSIADYSGMTDAINEYYGIGEDDGVGEEDAAGGDGEVEILGAIAVE